jgi:predicted HTH domain antitoxin
MTLKIDFPDEFLQELHLPKQEAQARVKRELALTLYAKGLLTFGKARQLAEMNRWDFRQLLGEESVLRRYDIDEFEQDLKTLEALD